jgi:pimeloyl-ACP methyl ester carboxylesterase
MTPRRAQQVLALAPQGTRYYGLPNAGHCPHDDAPAETSAALAEFFAL